MTPISSFALRRDSPVGAAHPRGTLLYEGRDFGLHLEVAALEAQLRVPPGLFLLFFTQSSPYEEELQIVLLDPHLQMLDGLRLGQAYTPGVLSGLHPEGDRRLSFEFFPALRLTLEVHPEGVFHLFRRLPSFASPLRGRLLSKHYLSVHPQTTP